MFSYTQILLFRTRLKTSVLTKSALLNLLTRRQGLPANQNNKRLFHNCSFSKFSFTKRTTTGQSNDTKEPPIQQKLKIKWFYATDVPISKPERFQYVQSKDPETFMPFSDEDSQKLEKAFLNQKSKTKNQQLVAVNEDHLFEVDLHKFSISPIYWEGPIYEVRRGIWFDSNGNPLEQKLSDSIESGYQSCNAYLPKSNKTEKREVIENTKEGGAGDVKIQVSQEDDLIHLPNGKLVLYLDEKNSFILPDSMNRFQMGVVRNFSSGALIGVKKITRGYSKEFEENFLSRIENPLPDLADVFQREITSLFSPIVSSKEKPDKLDENQNHQLKQEIENDYNKESNNDREIEHLVFCVHGIGQILGTKYESVNFTHSCNVLRKGLKDIFKQDVRYHKLAYPNEIFDTENEAYDKERHDYLKTNCKIQILPISWRHRVGFSPNTRFEEFDSEGEYRLPTLGDINVDGVKPIRNLIGEVALDILLYYEPEYLHRILTEVTKEINRVYKLYVEKNPDFKGKVHILGHSLGSVISFDILSKQPDETPTELDPTKDLEFEVDKFFAIGSPVGAFKLLQKTNIGSRSLNPYNPENTRMKSPKVNDFYNIFHPCDPVGYRMEPLINTEFSKYRPEQVPFALKGISTQIKDLADFGGEISQKVVAKASQAWQYTSNREKDPLKHIVSEIAQNADDPTKFEKINLSPRALKVITSCNRTGRVDYALPMGVFDISLVSAISAHVSYFEDENTAGFILSQLLSEQNISLKEKKVLLCK